MKFDMLRMDARIGWISHLPGSNHLSKMDNTEDEDMLMRLIDTITHDKYMRKEVK